MTRRTKIRAAHVTAATLAVVGADTFTAYAESQNHRTASGAWDGPVVIGWLLLLLSALYLVVLGCYGLYRLAVALWAALPNYGPPRRPEPGMGRREPSPSLDQWAHWDAEYAAYRRNARIADAMSRPLGDDDTRPMLLADITGLDSGSLIDAFAAYGIAPERVVCAADAPATVWSVPPVGLSGQGETLRIWFGDAFGERAA